MRISLRISLKRLRRGEDGIAALEFAMVAPVLLLLVMGTFELGLILTAQVLMESATYTASRMGKTGQGISDSTQAAKIKAEIARVGGLIMDPARIVVTSTYYKNFQQVEKPEPFNDANRNGKRDSGESFTDWNGNAKWDAMSGDAGYGNKDEVAVYTSTYSWPLFTPLLSSVMGQDGKVDISARAVVRNEPF